MSDFPYEIFHLDVVSKEARNDQARMRLYQDLTRLKTTNEARATAARALMESGAYIHAASVNAATAMDAILLTTNKYMKNWVLEKSKNIVPTYESSRSTSNRDIIVRFGKPFLFMPLGFLDLSSGEYADELV